MALMAVPQESFLLHETVLWNDAWRSEVNEADAEAALRAAGHGNSWPNCRSRYTARWRARYGALGRQTATYREGLGAPPKLLILDEVTSSLGPQTEVAICQTRKGFEVG